VGWFPNGKSFGAISSAEIAAALQQKEIEVRFAGGDECGDAGSASEHGLCDDSWVG
jgi:hypothetical protein